MNIAIVTLPLHSNYGGLLQAYALQTVLQRMGHKVEHLQLKSYGKPLHPKWRMPMVYSKRIWRKYFGGEKTLPIFMDPRKLMRKHTDVFIDTYIHARFLSEEEWNEQTMRLYDAIVFGSDQIWRPLYARPIERFFGNFMENSHIKRVAYAASFGTDENEFADEQLLRCSDLLSKFDAVSVREQSAVSMCMKNFSINAVHVLDPTLLLDVDDYVALIEKANVPKSKGTLGVYVLDEKEEINTFVNKFSQEKGLKPFRMGSNIENGDAPINERIQPPVEQWLNAFYFAEFIVTDSFHGTVFSILFKKPFICVGNIKRGMSRFNSLLSLFGLEERLVDISQLNELKFTDINWCEVYKIHSNKKKEAISFLKMALN